MGMPTENHYNDKMAYQDQLFAEQLPKHRRSDSHHDEQKISSSEQSEQSDDSDVDRRDSVPNEGHSDMTAIQKL